MADIEKWIDDLRANIEQGKRADELFETLRGQWNKDPERDKAWIEVLGGVCHPEAARLLRLLLEVSEEKSVRKSIKRSLYKLKSRGIGVEETAVDKTKPILRPLPVDPPRGFGGPVDAMGQRVLLLAIPHAGRGWTVMQGVVSDRTGLVSFSGGEIGRKGFRSLLEEIRKGGPAPLVEVDAPYVALLLTQAYAVTTSQGGTPPQEYAPFKAEIESRRKEDGQALIYSHLKAEEVRGDDRLLRRIPELLKADVFLGWGIEEARLRPYADSISEAEASKLVLSQVQKEIRIQEIYQRAVAELFGEDERRVYKRRMEEMSHYLLKRGRADEAKVSLAVALDLEKPPTAFQANPFLVQLVAQSMHRILNERQAEKSKEPSFIVKP
jgi:hypothetical protein